MKLKEYLKSKLVIMDGAMGTYYGEKYQRPDQSPELVNLSHPERIMAIHKEYLNAGTQLLRTNSFYSNLSTLAGSKGLEHWEREAMLPLLTRNISASHAIAKQAIKESGKKAWIAGDIGPVPEQGWSEEEIAEEYEVIVDAHLNAGAEILLVETFSDFNWLLYVAEYAKKQKDVFFMASFCLNTFGYTASGLSAAGILKTAEHSEYIDAIGFNCGIGSAHMHQILKDLDFGELIVSVAPNSGYLHITKDRNDVQETAEYFCDNMKKIALLGVNLIGACCGTSPAYIELLAKELSRPPFLRVKAKREEGFACACHKEKNFLFQKFNVNRKKENKRVVVVELAPPHDGSRESLLKASRVIKQAGADMITISDSPMGKLRADSILAAMLIQNETGMPTMPHITCRDRNRLGMGANILGAYMNGIRNLLLVTGDPLHAGDLSSTSLVFDFNSIKLMEYVRQMNKEHFSNDPIIFGGALNQGRANLEKEIERIRAKCEAGADYFLSQPIYREEDVKRIAYIKEQVDTKILCGIMPLVSYRNALFMKNEVFGIHVPEETILRYHPDMSRMEGEETGIAIALDLINKLKEIGDGYYFMAPFNRAAMIWELMKRIKKG